MFEFYEFVLIIILVAIQVYLSYRREKLVKAKCINILPYLFTRNSVLYKANRFFVSQVPTF